MYRVLDAQVGGSVMEMPVPAFSYEPIQPLRKPSAHTSTLSLQNLPLLFLVTLISFSLKIYWSRFLQAIYMLALLVLSSLPRRIAYASSNNHFLYAMRSDSGYLLWKRKRSRRNELVSNSPVRACAMLFTGSGTALAAALDFCRYAVQV